jgi:hypothetical protein
MTSIVIFLAKVQYQFPANNKEVPPFRNYIQNNTSINRLLVVLPVNDKDRFARLLTARTTKDETYKQRV